MRFFLDARARRMLRRLPKGGLFAALEIALLAVLALQCARLVWTILTPVGPLGEWRRDGDMGVTAPSPALFANFDPFFRLSQASGPAVVTGLNLKLFGVREDRASGRGSAIIGLPDGAQASFAVGDEILPGVKLGSVAFDHVMIRRGGAEEQLFIDQSVDPSGVQPQYAGAR